MGVFRMPKKPSLYDKADNRIQKISKTISAIIIVIGAATGMCSWVSNQFAIAVSDQISSFRQEMEIANKKHEQTITRVELIALLEHDPNNIAAIEKTAKYYFRDLDSDSYMLQKYSDWAKQYNGDITIIIGIQ